MRLKLGYAGRREQLQGLKQHGIETLALDVTSQESAKSAVGELLAAESRLDVLICNAGKYIRSNCSVRCCLDTRHMVVG